jgi:hypothetical protein
VAVTTLQRSRDFDLIQSVSGTPDVVHLSEEVRLFLTGFDELMAAVTKLVAVLLASDAFRYGQPPVRLRMKLIADGAYLRLEVEDHGSVQSNPRPYGYRANLLDWVASRRGVKQATNGTTTVWVEIPAKVERTNMSRQTDKLRQTTHRPTRASYDTWNVRHGDV